MTSSVRRLKGPSRPVRSDADRLYVLAALESVDAVTMFGEDTPLELVRALAPDVIVKGGDYTEDDDSRRRRSSRARRRRPRHPARAGPINDFNNPATPK